MGRWFQGAVETNNSKCTQAFCGKERNVLGCNVAGITLQVFANKPRVCVSFRKDRVIGLKQVCLVHRHVLPRIGASSMEIMAL